MIGKRFVTVAAVVDAAWIHTGHKTGSTGRADRTLAVRMSERCTIVHQPVQRRRAHMRITERTDGIEPLLVGAVPQNVGTALSHR